MADTGDIEETEGRGGREGDVLVQSSVLHGKVITIHRNLPVVCTLITAGMCSIRQVCVFFYISMFGLAR